MSTPAERAARSAKRAAKFAQLAATESEEETAEKQLAESGPQQDAKEMLAGLPAEAEIKLYRFVPGTAKLEFCEAYAEAAEFNEQNIRQKWGAGIFRLVVRVPDKSGRMVFPSSGSARVFRLAAMQPGAALAPIAPSEKPHKWEDTMAMQLFQALMAQQQQQAQAMRESQESHRAMIAMMLRDTSKPDPSIDLFKSMLPLFMPSKTDPMDMALKMAALLKPNGPAAGGLVEQMTMLEKFLAIIKKGEGGGEGSDKPVWFEALKEVAPLIQSALTAPKPAAALPPVVPAPPTAPAVVPIPPPPPPLPLPSEEPVIQLHPMIAQLDRMMPILIESAALKLNTELQADWALERIPEAYFEDFVTWIERPEAVSMLMLRYPDAAVYREWFTELVAAMIGAIEEEGENEDTLPLEASFPPAPDGHEAEREQLSTDPEPKPELKVTEGGKRGKRGAR